VPHGKAAPDFASPKLTDGSTNYEPKAVLEPLELESFADPTNKLLDPDAIIINAIRKDNASKPYGQVKLSASLQDKDDADALSELTQEPVPPPQLTKDSTKSELFYDYLLMVWDGLGFFGLDDTKLARLRGEKVTFKTKFFSRRWVMASCISVLAVFYILLTEISKLDTLKSQTISLLPQETFTYNMTDIFPLILVSYLVVDELLPVIKAYQEAHLNDPDVMQHGEGRLIPLVWEEVDWFDHQYMEWFVCSNQRLAYS
jgi:hypothetical protein